MRTALVDPRHASASFRSLVLVLSACIAGCSGKPATGALQVLVNLEAGLKSRCVKVVASDGTSSKETGSILLAGKGSPLHVAVYGDGLVQPVTVQAIGFSDDGCTARTGEVSESLEGSFTSPVSTVTLTLRPVSSGDGGFNPDGGSDGGLGDGGVDAGVDAGTGDGGVSDAGIDADGDGSPSSADCDDTNPAIYPGAAESCTNGIDDDCDSKADCQQDSCDGFICTGTGTCTNRVCIAPSEVLCNDGVDNDGDGRVDCADADCPGGTQCNDNNSCTSGDRCVADGGCEKTTDTACTTPPNALCWAAAGVCLPDAGATCEYTQRTGTCDDGLACTTADSCTSGTCGGAPKPCNTPGNVCLAPTGSCQEPAGSCSYAPLATGACNDGQNCTVNDSCDGDGGCAGTQVTCTAPSQCENPTGACNTDGGCLFQARTGACDAGSAAGAATCQGAVCTVTPASLFPFKSNFTEPQVPPTDGGVAFTVACNTTITTSGTPSISSTCGMTMPPSALITPSAGESTLLLAMNSLTVNSGQTLIIQGTRPVIFAVVGNVTVNGTIRARNPGTPTACGNGGNGGVVSGEGGGGGGGFGTTGAVGGVRSTGGAGALGGPNGVDTLLPLRSGCKGGNGNGTGGTGGAGGGALQISATGTLTVSGTGVITAPGLGGGGATGGDDSGGGGGSGGALLLEATLLQFDSGSWLSANGGGGGGGEDGGDGIAGDPGSENSTTAAAGGTANNNAGAGGRGATRTTSVQAGAASTAGNAGAGGGGGGMGRIRLNATSCTVNGGSNRTPAATSTGTNCP